MELDTTLDREYSIEPYDPRWAAKFEEIKKMLKEVFKDKALEIEHVGSTSVPGLKSEPLIDAIVVVEKMEPFVDERELMTSRGYSYRDDYIEPNSILFYKFEGNRKLENIHVFVKGSAAAKQFIVMRDYFRAHPDKVKEYGDLKDELKKKFPNEYAAYKAGKYNFLENIESLANQ